VIGQNTSIVDRTESKTPTARGNAPPSEGPSETLRAFLTRLSNRYGLWRSGLNAAPDAGDVDEQLTSLTLAQAALHYTLATRADRPLQVAVLGPTQAGKSTLVNLIVGAAAAEVSPLAGFTVHPRGVEVGDTESDGWQDTLLPGWTRLAEDQLTRERLEAYALTRLTDEAEDLSLPPCVVWDTPDFDSLSAGRYRRGVLEIAALADALVVVLSKEKYSDLSVWKMLRLMEPLGTPMIVVLNKLTPEARDAIQRSLCERLEEYCPFHRAAQIVQLSYVPDTARLGCERDYGPLITLRGWLTGGSRLSRGERRSGCVALLKRHWGNWTAPIRAEQEARRAWGELVDAALEAMLRSYRREFLDDSRRYDTFRLATVELLHLLELPGAAHALGKIRSVLTWPARQLIGRGRALLSRSRARSGPRPDLAGEERVLFDLIDTLLTGLQRDAFRRRDAAGAGAALWAALARRMDCEQETLREKLRRAARRHHLDFRKEVTAAAGRLYDMLRDRPALLNVLRTARVTTDVASIAIAIKTAGTPLNDVLFAPAMFAFTSMLTEGALGTYMRRVEDELRQTQFEHVRGQLVNADIGASLRGLADDMEDEALFGVSAEQLDEAHAALDAWGRGEDE